MSGHNASDKSKVAAAEKKNKIEREQEIEDVRTILKTPAGMRFFKRVFNRTHLFRTTYTGNSETYFREGERNIGLWLLTDVQIADKNKIPELLVNLEQGED